MEDVTNGINNIGKPPSEKDFILKLSWRELVLLRKLLQNPHPNYEGSEELMKFCEENFNVIDSLIDYHTGRRRG